MTQLANEYKQSVTSASRHILVAPAGMHQLHHAYGHNVIGNSMATWWCYATCFLWQHRCFCARISSRSSLSDLKIKCTRDFTWCCMHVEVLNPGNQGLPDSQIYWSCYKTHFKKSKYLMQASATIVWPSRCRHLCRGQSESVRFAKRHTLRINIQYMVIRTFHCISHELIQQQFTCPNYSVHCAWVEKWDTYGPPDAGHSESIGMQQSVTIQQHHQPAAAAKRWMPFWHVV